MDHTEKLLPLPSSMSWRNTESERNGRDGNRFRTQNSLLPYFLQEFEITVVVANVAYVERGGSTTPVRSRRIRVPLRWLLYV